MAPPLLPQLSNALARTALALIAALALGWLAVQGAQALIPRVINLPQLAREVERELPRALLTKPGWRLSLSDPTARLTLAGARLDFQNAELLNPKGERVLLARNIAITARYWPLIIGGKPELSQSDIAAVEAGLPDPLPLRTADDPPPPENQKVTIRDFSIHIHRMQATFGSWAAPGRHLRTRVESLSLRHLASDRDTEAAFHIDIWQSPATLAQHATPGLVARAVVDAAGRPAEDNAQTGELSRLNLSARQVDLTQIDELLSAFGVTLPVRAQGRLDSLQARYSRSKGLLASLSGASSAATAQEDVSLEAVSREPTRWRNRDGAGQIAPGRLRLRARISQRRRVSDLRFALFPLQSAKAQDKTPAESLAISGWIEAPPASQAEHADWTRARGDLRVVARDFPLSALRVAPAPDAATAQALRALQGTFSSDLAVQGLLVNPQLGGSLSLSRAAAVLPSGAILAQNLSGALRFDRDWIYVASLQGRALGGILSLAGRFNRKSGELAQGALTLEGLNLSQAQEALQSLASLQGRPLPGALSRGRLQGRVNAHLRASGKARDPNWQGSIVVSDGALLAPSSSGFQPLLHHLEAAALCEGRRVTVHHARAFLLTSPINAAGAIDRTRETVGARVTMESMPIETLRRALLLASQLSIGAPSDLRALANARTSGSVSGVLTISGPWTQPAMSGRWTLSRVNLAMDDSAVGAALGAQGLSGQIQLTPGRVLFSNVRGQWQNMAFLADGALLADSLASTTYRRYQARIRAQGDLKQLIVRLSKTMPALSALRERDASGFADVDLDVNGLLPASASKPAPLPTVRSGRVRVRNLSIALAPGSPDRLTMAQADIVSRGDGTLRLLPTAARYSGVSALAEGVIRPQTGGYDLTIAMPSTPVTALVSVGDWAQRFPLLHNATVERPLQGALSLRARISERGGDARLHLERVGGPWREDYRWGPVTGEALANWRGPLTEMAALNAQFTGQAREFSSDGRLALSSAQGALAGPITVHWRENNAETGGFDAAVSLSDKRWQLKDGALNLGDNIGRVMLEATLEHPLDEGRQRLEAAIETPEPLNLEPLAPSMGLPADDMGGQLAVKLAFHGRSAQDALIWGVVDLENLRSRWLQLENITGRISLEGIGGQFDFSQLRIPGVKLSAKGAVEDAAAFPLALNDVTVSGDLFAVDAWRAYTRNILDARLYRGIFVPLFGPARATDPQVPFQFSDAKLAISEVIYDNILVNNLRARMNLASSGFFELVETTAQVAGGRLKGHLAITPLRNQYTQVTLEAEDVKANALARALLNAPNQIFGDLSGSIRFTTQGLTDAEMTDNANGDAAFTIKDGRLPAIAKLETMLTAVNVLRGGVLGLNFNNLLRTVSVFNTNYFTELSGNLNILQGTAYTDNLLSDGENLDLLITGRIRLKDAQANLKVIGSMSQNVSGALGQLGKLSLNSLLRYLPGVGFLPGVKNGGLLSFVPGVGFVPGFGGRPKDMARFSVKIRGALDNENAVQDFEWLP